MEKRAFLLQPVSGTLTRHTKGAKSPATVNSFKDMLNFEVFLQLYSVWRDLRSSVLLVCLSLWLTAPNINATA